MAKKAAAKKAPKKTAKKKTRPQHLLVRSDLPMLMLPRPEGAGPAVLDRLWDVITSRRNADPMISHSARLLARGTPKIAQKFGEEAVECVIEAVAGNRAALIAESADVLYHLIVMWVDGGVRAEEVWAELERREGVSGVAEKISRAARLAMNFGHRTRKIP